MEIFEKKNRDKIWSKYTLKRTKLHHLKKISRGSMPPNPPNNVHGFAMRSMSLRDMQIPKSEEKKFLAPPFQILGTPLPFDMEKLADVSSPHFTWQNWLLYIKIG